MANQISVRYLGHSCVEFDFDGTKVLLDPFVKYNPLAAAVGVDSLKPDYIFLSHAHQDHYADLQLVQGNSDATVACIYETAALIKKMGIPAEKVIDYNLGGTLTLPFGKVKMVYAMHSNSTPDGEYAGFPCGYVFFIGDKKIYFAGDTALTMEMKLLADLELDWAFLPIGGHYTMDMHDAVRAAQFVNCTKVVGIHYDSFPPIQIDKEEAIRLFAKHDLELNLPAIGTSISL